MGFKKATKSRKNRAPDTPYDDVAPGLYPGETAVLLDGTADDVAVSVESKWLDNGEGVHIRSWARAIGPDGATLLGPHGQHLETVASHTFPMAKVLTYGVPALEREMLLVVMGEPPTMVDVLTVPGAAAAPTPAGTTTKPAEKKAPLEQWSDDVRMNWNIRHAITIARDTSPLPNAAKRLGI